MKSKIETKRRIYIFFAIVLWTLLGLIAHTFIEKSCINNLLLEGLATNGNCSKGCLPYVNLMSIFLVGGAILGYVIGVRWWQLVYVEKHHWRIKK